MYLYRKTKAIMNNLIIKNKLGRDLTNNINAWKQGFIDVDQAKHWSEGYSAQSLGQFFTSGSGKVWLDNLSKLLFNSSIEYESAEIEHRSKLDSYRGMQRMQDLALWGKIGSKSVFIAIEAKVLESFGNYSVRDEYELALLYRDKNPNSKKPNRVEDVVKFFFPELTPYDEPVCNLRYQLFHYFKASVLEGKTSDESKKSLTKRTHPDIVILPVMVFKTKHYFENTPIAEQNKKDYLAFCKALGFAEKSLGNRTVFYKDFCHREIYTLYEEISI